VERKPGMKWTAECMVLSGERESVREKENMNSTNKFE